MWKKFLKIKTAIIIMLISLLCSFAVSAADNKEALILMIRGNLYKVM